jgi:hypothetical protein
VSEERPWYVTEIAEAQKEHGAALHNLAIQQAKMHAKIDARLDLLEQIEDKRENQFDARKEGVVSAVVAGLVSAVILLIEALL